MIREKIRVGYDFPETGSAESKIWQMNLAETLALYPAAFPRPPTGSADSWFWKNNHLRYTFLLALYIDLGKNHAPRRSSDSGFSEITAAQKSRITPP
jgi:hypothetical protein